MGSGSGNTVEWKGLTEFEHALDAASRELTRDAEKALKVTTSEIVAPAVRAKMEHAFKLPLGDKRDGKHRSGKLFGSVTSKTEGELGLVSIGVGIRYAGWWIYGGSTNSPRGDTSREYVREGRAVGPALHESEVAIHAEMERTVLAVRNTIYERSL